MNLILKKHIIIVAVTLFVLTGQVVLFLDYLPILSGLFSLLRIVLFCFLFVEAYRHRLRFSSFEKQRNAIEKILCVAAETDWRLSVNRHRSPSRQLLLQKMQQYY